MKPNLSFPLSIENFDELLSFCLFYENGEEWARHVFERSSPLCSGDSSLFGQKLGDIEKKSSKRTIEGSNLGLIPVSGI